jgi:hypothetical protein
MVKLNRLTSAPPNSPSLQAYMRDWRQNKQKEDFDYIESLAAAIMKSAKKGKRSVNRIGTHAEKDYFTEKVVKLRETVKELP